MTHMRSGAIGLNLSDSVYERLLAERIIFLGQEIDDAICNQIIAVMLFADAEDPVKETVKALEISEQFGEAVGTMLNDNIRFVINDDEATTRLLEEK